MLVAARRVDRKTRAERVERCRRHGELAPRHGQGVDHDARIDRRLVDALQFGIEEAHVEGGVVGDQLGAGEELQELVRDLGEQRLVGQEIVGNAVHVEGGRVDLAAGRTDEGVIVLAGRNVVPQFHPADLDDPLDIRIEAGGFGIEDDFAHEGSR